MLNQMLFTSSYWTPASIPTVFWYDAADSSTITATGSEVTQVLDKSGNSKTLVRASGQTGPLTRTRNLNGLNVLEWPSTAGGCLQHGAFTHDQATTALNVAIVTQVDAAPGTQCFFMAGSTSTATGKRLSVRSTASSGLLEILGGNGTSNSSLFCGAYTRLQPNIVLIKFNAANSACRMNGSPVITSGGLGTNAFSILSWGHNEGESSDLFGYLGEMIAFTDNAKQEIVEGYLAWKWNLTGNLPSGHPYKTTAPRL